MTEEIVFYHNPRSRAQMVHWMLEEASAPYRIVPIDFEKGEHKTPSFLAINPMGKLPTIVHRGIVVTETAAIIAYIVSYAIAFPLNGRAGKIAARLKGTAQGAEREELAASLNRVRRRAGIATLATVLLGVLAACAMAVARYV